MNTQQRLGTIFFLIALALCIAIFDVIVLKRLGPRATISSTLLNACYIRPWGLLIPIAFGILIGHLFVPQRSP